MEKNLQQEAGTIEAMIRLYCRERRHPLLALRHGFRKRRKPEASPVKKKQG